MRNYNPGMGVFTSQDPMGFSAGNMDLDGYAGTDQLPRLTPAE